MSVFHLSLRNYISHNKTLSNPISQKISVFHGIKAPEEGWITGYGAIIDCYQLPVPIPKTLSLISTKNRKYATGQWRVFTPRHQPRETLYDHLVFALKYEGINLLFFKKLFEKLSQNELLTLLQNEPLGQYSRRIWFLYEWLMGIRLPIEDLKRGNFVPLIDAKLQFSTSESHNSSRHRIRNNLPGTVDFCPLIFKTEKLAGYIKSDLAARNSSNLSNIHKDVLQRTSAFLLLKDSKASFSIEGETPTGNRAVKWGRAIGQAGSKPLNRAELLRLQQIVIGNSRFVKMGFRDEGGFVGQHDRLTGEPIPDHISARHQDIDQLINGLLKSADKIETTGYDAVLAAASIAFGFVFIHPFADGNGRIHRYLIHHILAIMKFTQQGIIFPVSAAILNRIDDYRHVLESYSQPLLDLIEWRKTANNNVAVLNETIDYYRYFDATLQAEFLYDCVYETIERLIPEEVAYLQKYDEMKSYLDDVFQMPDSMVALLMRFLEQNNGELSKRAREKEFAMLTDEEAKDIEKRYNNLFSRDGL